MKKMVFLLLLSTPLLSNAQNTKVITADFHALSGSWKGKLIYLDYKSNKPYEMPADIEIIPIGKSGRFKFINSYPNESSANSTDTLIISGDGTKIDGETVISREILANENIKIVTEVMDKDGNDNRTALIRHTYLLGKSNFEIKKEVRFEGTSEFILRHTCIYERK